MNKRIIMGSIIAIAFLSVPISSAIDINANFENESCETTNIESLNTYYGVITFIKGSCTWIEEKGGGLIQCVEIWEDDPLSEIEVFGFRIFGNIPRHPTYIKAPRFIGYCIQCQPAFFSVIGIALGPFEWS